MAFHGYSISFTELLIIVAFVYILILGTSYAQFCIEGDKEMPFRDLAEDEFLSTEIVNVKKYGAMGDGTKDDSSAITAAITATNGATLLLPAGTYKLGSNVTVPSNVAIWFTNGAKLSIDSGVTLTINGKLDAGLNQIFSGSGTVSIAKGSVPYILPQWWGALGDGSHDDTSAINTALDVASQKLTEATAPKVREVFLPNGIYKITSPLLISYGTSLRGNGMNSTYIHVYGDVNGINMSVTVTPAGDYDNSVLSNFHMRNMGTPGVGYGINMANQRSASVEQVWIGGWYSYNCGFERGIYLHEGASYYTTIRRCMLFRNTYNIYLGYGANDARIVENDMWYGDYGVYVELANGVRILNNTIENFAQKAVYTNCSWTDIAHNWIESSGKYSVELGPNSDRCWIHNNTSASGLWTHSDVLNNSLSPYHRINDEYIPIGLSALGNSLALGATISCGQSGTSHTDTTIRAIDAALILEGGSVRQYYNAGVRLPSFTTVNVPVAVSNAPLDNEVLRVCSSDTKYPGIRVHGGSKTGKRYVNNGQIMIGVGANDCGSIAYDYVDGRIYIDNVLDYDTGRGIYLRTRSEREGKVLTLSINTAGTGYTVGDDLTVVQDPYGHDCVANVDTIDGSGGVTGVTILTAGYCYSAASGLATTGGTGTGCKINVLTTGSANICIAIVDKAVGMGGAPVSQNYRLDVQSTATNQPAAIFRGGSTLGSNAVDGQIRLGSNDGQYSLITNRYSSGDLYIDNTLNYADDAYGAIRIRTKTAGTPVNALTILASGKTGFNTTAPAAQVAINGGLHVGGTTDPGDDNLTVDGKASAKTINGAVSALTNSSTISCDMNNGNVFTLSTTTAVGNVQINATNGVAGQRVTFIITDDATGGHVVTFGTNFKSSGTLTGTANKAATVDFVYNGTNWYEVSRTTGL